MAKLKATIAKLEDVEEQYRGLYTKQDDDTFVLDVDGSDYKNKLNEFRSNNITLNKAKGDLEEKLKQFANMDPKKYAEAVNALNALEENEDKELIKAGKVDEVVKKRMTKFEQDTNKQIKVLTDRASEAETDRDVYKNELGKLKLDGKAREALSKIASLRKGAEKDALSRARESFQIDKKGELAPLGTDGQTVYGKKGEPLTMDEWATTLLEEAAFLFEPGEGGGAGGGKKGDAENKNKKGTIDGKDPLAIGRNLKDVASGKLEVTGLSVQE